MARRKQKALDKLAEAISELREGAESQLDYEAKKTITYLMWADTLEDFKRIKDNTPKEVRHRVRVIAEEQYPVVWRKLVRLSRISKSSKKPDLSNCL